MNRTRHALLACLQNEVCRTLALAVLLPWPDPRQERGPEPLAVRGHGLVDVATFDCQLIGRSAMVRRICYNAGQRRAVVEIGGVDHQFCDIPPAVISSWMAADSMGRYYAAHVSGRYRCAGHSSDGI